MREFELCYEPYGGDGVFVPDLFEEKEPDFDFDYENCIRFSFEYEYLPGPVMPRFMVRRHGDIEGDLRWRTGVVLKDDKLKSRGLVRADKRQRIIYVYVSGEQKRDYLAVIRKTINDINNSFQKLNIKEWIPLPDQETTAVEYADLIGHYLAGKEDIFIGKLGRSYSVMQLLDGIESRKETRSNISITAGDEANIEVDTRIEGGIVAKGRARVNIEIKVEQAVEHLDELKKIIEEQPKEKMPDLVKRKGLEIIHDALKDVAKRKLTEAAKKVLELGMEAAPMIINTAAYNFFQGMMVM
jgi:hypothetical protein